MQLSFFELPEVRQLIVPPAMITPPHGRKPVPPPCGPQSKPAAHLDYRITEADPVGEGGQMAKVRANLAAIKLLAEIQSQNRQATPEEQKRLVLYSGWGHTAQPFHPQPKGKWAELQQELRPHFSDREWAAAAASTLNAHYTSPTVIRWVWQVVKRLGFTGGKVVEPAAGVLHFYGLMPEAIRAKSKLWACELDLLTGSIAKQLYPSVNLFGGGFETAPYEDDFFDLAISNVPFSDIRVTDPRIFHNGRGYLSDVGLHNYYFIKALDIVRPGGLVAFITSRFTMDSQEEKVRAYLSQRAHLLGAVRLPVNTFKKNAHTEVTTDVIFLMKKGGSEAAGYDWTATVAQPDAQGNKYHLNEFYHAHPEMLIGEMKLEGGRFKDAVEAVTPPNFDLAEALQRRLELPVFPRGSYSPVAEVRRLRIVEPETLEAVPVASWLREGSYYVDDHYRVWQKSGPKWNRANLEGKQLSRVRGLAEVRDAFRKVVEANVQYSHPLKLKQAQAELETVYRRFVSRWGYLHETANISAFSEDADADNILALERWDPYAAKATKAAIFTQRLVTPNQRPEQADTAMDALTIALRETGRVDFARMIDLTDRSQAELVEDLGEWIFQVEQARGPRLWITADEYLSGNIREKLAQAEQWAKADPAFERNVRTLRGVLPPDVGPKDIFAQLGAPWIPEWIVEEFVNEHLFNTTLYAPKGYVRIHYLDVVGYWKIDDETAGPMTFSAANTKKWGTNRITGLDLIEKCLNGQMATIYDTIELPDGKEKRKVNQEATLVARAKQNELKAEFEKWLWADSGRANELARLYNDRFNSVIPRRYDGAHLDFPGLNPALVLRQIQKDVIWRGLQSRSIMIAHQVGFGKTYSQIGLTARLKQIGLRRRLMLVVKRATFGQIVAAYKEAYPFADITTIASGQSPQQRRRQLARIVTEDFDAIITTHPVYSKIPLKPETKLRFLQEQLAELEAAILRCNDRISTKELEKAKKRLEGKIKREMEKGAARDPNTLYFEDLGIDALLVDEANAYKNLWFHTVRTRVSGVGGTESGRAFDMFLKVRITQERGGFIAFATGTPVENSISEIYTMMRFLMPEELKRLGLHHFDAWASTFGKVVTAVEMKPDGSGFQMKARFASFNNLPQLKRLWWQVADVQMDAEKAGIKLPQLVSGKPIGIQAEAYPELKQIIQTLANRANNLGEVDPSVDNILVIISDADKASLDARLLGQFPVVDENGEKTGEHIHITEDYEGSKVNLCADKVAEIYKQTTNIEIPGQSGRYDASEHPKGCNLAQLVFLDSSVPRAMDKELAISDPDAFTTVYEDLRRKLIARGVKADEIAFAQNWNTDEKKEALAAALNAGRIRVAIGSTEVMGIGLNCQRLLVALHHLDCPWKPAWLEQREGRIKRQGNLCPEIAIYRYVMAGSFDVYRWQTVERKYSFIVAFNSPDLTQRSIEDPGMAVLSAREMTALATGNPKIIQQIELQTRLRTLTALRNEFNDSRYYSQTRRDGLMVEQAEWQEKLDRRSALSAVVQAEGLDGCEKLGAQLYELCEPHFEVYDRKVPVGEIYGIPVFYEGQMVEIEPEQQPKDVRTFWTAGTAEENPAPVEKKFKTQRRVVMEHEGYRLFASISLRIFEDTRAETNTTALKSVFGLDLTAKVDEAQQRVAGINDRLAQLDKILAETFPHDAEIAEIETELLKLDLEIKNELGDADAESRQAARVDLDTTTEEETEEETEVELD